MKIKFLSAMAICAALASCGQGASNGNGGQDKDTAAVESPVAAPAVQEKSVKTDWAFNFMKSLDRKYFPAAITQEDFDRSFNTDYREDEQTGEFFPYFSVMHSSDGCYDIAQAYTFEKKDGKSCLAIFVTEAGCDGASTTGVKAFSYDGTAISEIECPIARPSFDELTAGISDPSLESLKGDYARGKGLEGLDIRLEKGEIAIRPGSLGYDDLYEQFSPAIYTFNGETLVKK